jgi:hypothetical protein
MTELSLPPYPFKLKTVNQQTQIFDEVRKRWYICTPEEWVRQHVVMFLNLHFSYPLGLFALEKSLQFKGMKRRTDILMYNAKGEAKLLVECKAPEIALNQDVLDQAARYNMTLGVPFILITNGLQHYCLSVNKENKVKYLDAIPHFSEL